MFRVSAACLGLSLAQLTCSLHGQVSLPYETDFEAAYGFVVDSPPSQTPWTVGTSGAVVTSLDFASASQGVLLPVDDAGFLDADFAYSQAGLVAFVDFYLKPMAAPVGQLPEVSSDLTSAMTGVVEEGGMGWFYVVQGDGLGGGQWQRVPWSFSLVGGVAANWIRLTYRLNYATKTWDLYLNDDLVATDLRFMDDVLEGLEEFRLKGGGLAPVYFDFFYAGYENPIFVDSDNDGMSDAYETANSLNLYVDDRYGDSDFDGITNIQEFLYDLAAGNPDTDADGLHDGWELATGGDPVTAGNYVLSQLPYTEGFESHPDTNVTSGGGWSYLGGDEPQITSAEAASGSNAVEIRPFGYSTELYNLFSALPDTIVWVDFFIKPGALVEEPALSSVTSAGFYFGEDGVLRVFDGAGVPDGAWLALANDPVETDAWQWVTVQLNYSTQRWAVYLNGVRLESGLGFANPVPYFQAFRIRESDGGQTYLDDVQVSYTEPLDLDNDGDGLTNAWEIAAAAYGYDPEYAYSADPTGMVRDDFYDLDQDGLGTQAELDAGTQYANADTDGDGVLDGSELSLGEDPLTQGTFNHLVADGNDVYSWSAGFETAEGYSVAALEGQNLWRADSTDVTVTASQAHSGSQAMTLASGMNGVVSAEQWLVSPVGAQVVWVSFNAKMVGGALPDLSERETLGAAYFMMNDAGKLCVYEGGSAQWVDTGLDVNAANWTRFDVRLDYATKTWDIWVEGDQVSAENGFANASIPAFSRIRVEQLRSMQDQGYIDALSISTAMPDSLSPWPQVPDAWKQQIVDADASDGLTDPSQVLAGDDFDGDGLSNEEEYRQGKLPTVADADVQYYVSGDTGSDINYNGLSLVPGQPTSLHGPKVSLSGALAVASDGSCILIESTAAAYDESTLSLAGKNLVLRPHGDITVQ